MPASSGGNNGGPELTLGQKIVLGYCAAMTTIAVVLGAWQLAELSERQNDNREALCALGQIDPAPQGDDESDRAYSERLQGFAVAKALISGIDCDDVLSRVAYLPNRKEAIAAATEAGIDRETAAAIIDNGGAGVGRPPGSGGGSDGDDGSNGDDGDDGDSTTTTVQGPGIVDQVGDLVCRTEINALGQKVRVCRP